MCFIEIGQSSQDVPLISIDTMFCFAMHYSKRSQHMNIEMWSLAQEIITILASCPIWAFQVCVSKRDRLCFWAKTVQTLSHWLSSHCHTVIYKRGSCLNFSVPTGWFHSWHNIQCHDLLFYGDREVKSQPRWLQITHRKSHFVYILLFKSNYL